MTKKAAGMKQLASWFTQNVEIGRDPDDPEYFFIRVGAWSLGVGSGIFDTIAFHFEHPWGLFAFEV